MPVLQVFCIPFQPFDCQALGRHIQHPAPDNNFSICFKLPLGAFSTILPKTLPSFTQMAGQLVKYSIKTESKSITLFFHFSDFPQLFSIFSFSPPLWWIQSLLMRVLLLMVNFSTLAVCAFAFCSTKSFLNKLAMCDLNELIIGIMPFCNKTNMSMPSYFQESIGKYKL